MRAVYCPKYGPPAVLEVRDLPQPEMKKGHMIVRVHAVAVTSGDARIRAARFPMGMGFMARLGLGLFGPRAPVLGMTYAGVVAAVAADVTGVAVGQRVFGMTGIKMGAMAEYVRVAATSPVVTLPDSVDFVRGAAASFGGTTALHFLKHKARVQPDDRVMILGASGQVGVAAVQIAKHLGAHVTGVCSGKNMALVKGLGADEVIDYTVQDPLSQGAYDVIMSCVGSATFAQDMVSAMKKPDAQGRHTIGGVAREDAADLALLGDMMVTGAFDPVVTQTFPLAQAAAAHAVVDTGRKVGAVVLEV